MATGMDLERIALSLEGTVACPHFDRTAFKVVRTYVTLAADGKSANVKFTPDQQAFKCMMAPDAFTTIPNGWGRMGWTRVELSNVGDAELQAALEMAWELGRAKPRPRRG